MAKPASASDPALWESKAFILLAEYVFPQQRAAWLLVGVGEAAAARAAALRSPGSRWLVLDTCKHKERNWAGSLSFSFA